MKYDWIICPLRHPVASLFRFPFLGDDLQDRSKKIAALDFVLVEVAGLGAVTTKEPAKVGPDSVLRSSVELELELTDLFTEVSESIWLSPACVEESFIVTF